jgi:small subunit ribosomal protein S18
MARNSKTRTKKKPDPKRIPIDRKGRVRRGRPKICQFCAEHSEWVDYKDINVLRRYLNDRGRIRARGATGTCAQHQRDVAVAIKTAREMALLPYSVRTFAPGAGERRSGPREGRPPQPASGEQAAETAASPEPDNALEDTEDTEDTDTLVATN